LASPADQVHNDSVYLLDQDQRELTMAGKAPSIELSKEEELHASVSLVRGMVLAGGIDGTSWMKR
jgi:hypothetical protein